MALQFPTNPSVNQTYQSGSSATYQWNGTYWQTVLPTIQTVVAATSASFATSAATASRTGFMITESVTIGGSTTAPTKGSSRTMDKIVLADHGNGLCTVIVNYYQTNGGASGTGDYLFTLPGGYQFDTSVHSAYAVAGDPNMSGVESWIPGSSGMLASAGGLRMNAYAAVWDSTRFRILQGGEAIYSSNASIRYPVGSALYQLVGANIGYQMSFTFKKL